jgi:hypothetical protein
MIRLTLALIASALAVISTAGADAPKRDLPKWLDERIAKVWPSADEKRIDQIGWATEILAARELAKKHNRPVFLFTHDGHMAVGRC